MTCLDRRTAADEKGPRRRAIRGATPGDVQSLRRALERRREGSVVKPMEPHILTLNGGSSSIKFALYQAGRTLEQKLSGQIDRIGLPGTNLTAGSGDRRSLAVSDHESPANFLIDWLAEQVGFEFATGSASSVSS